VKFHEFKIVSRKKRGKQFISSSTGLPVQLPVSFAGGINKAKNQIKNVSVEAFPLLSSTFKSSFVHVVFQTLAHFPVNENLFATNKKSRVTR